MIQEINNDKKYYIELVPQSEYKKYQQIEKIIKKLDKLNKLGVDTSKIKINKINRFFVSTYKDGSNIPTPYFNKNELFNNKYDTKVILFTKEEAQKYTDKINNYVENWVATIKAI